MTSLLLLGSHSITDCLLFATQQQFFETMSIVIVQKPSHSKSVCVFQQFLLKRCTLKPNGKISPKIASFLTNNNRFPPKKHKTLVFCAIIACWFVFLAISKSTFSKVFRNLCLSKLKVFLNQHYDCSILSWTKIK